MSNNHTIIVSDDTIDELISFFKNANTMFQKFSTDPIRKKEYELQVNKIINQLDDVKNIGNEYISL